ncbi:hypothetical protein [Spirosoma sp. 209]|uniref:hypothetical protein n=1 Tax=Spirosoma sp. 209 TaxID=1955701 RepID=UPI00098D5625|nr:hypothetical protein [Spirosoma sp. 209]
MNVTHRKLDQQAVRMAATTLILAEGCTTTLMVQQFLRNQGYSTYQADISDWLNEVAQQENWNVDQNPLFRVYHFPTFSTLPQ